MLLAFGLAGASLVWLVAVAAASATGPGAWTSDAVRTFASFVCHQEPDRSFFWSGAPWAVCARCLGLYAAAPAGAILAIASGRSRPSSPRANVRLLALAGAPTLLTWLAEHAAGLPITNVMRFVAALPLGAAVAWLLVRTAIDTRRPAVSQYTLGDARRGETR